MRWKRSDKERLGRDWKSDEGANPRGNGLAECLPVELESDEHLSHHDGQHQNRLRSKLVARAAKWRWWLKVVGVDGRWLEVVEGVGRW